MANPTKSGLYVHTYLKLMDNTTWSALFNLTADTYKLALVNNTATDGSGNLNFSLTDTSWTADSTEATGTSWATGGRTLATCASGGGSTSPTIAEGTGGSVGSLRYDMGDVLVASSTVSNIWGCIIYADPITTPADLADAMVVYVNFGQAYSPNNGNFGITWSNASPGGVWEIDLTP